MTKKAAQPSKTTTGRTKRPVSTSKLTIQFPAKKVAKPAKKTATKKVVSKPVPAKKVPVKAPAPVKAKRKPRTPPKKTVQQRWEAKLRSDAVPLPVIKPDDIKRVDDTEDGYDFIDTLTLAKLQFQAPTEKLIKHLVKEIEQGNRPEVAFGSLGILQAQSRQWLLLGMRDLDSVYGLLVKAIRIAEARSECQDVRAIREGRPSWTAKAWLRARTAPNRWGDRTAVDVSGLLDDAESVREPEPMLLQDAATILALLEKAGALTPEAMVIDADAVAVDGPELLHQEVA